MVRAEHAVTLKKNGYNCCQSVMAAFAEETGLPDEMLRSIGAAFGGGMGGMEGPCGALCGAEMTLGMLQYQGKPIHALARRVHASFLEKTGSQICREIKGIGTGKILCPCEDCIRNAVAALEEALGEES